MVGSDVAQSSERRSAFDQRSSSSELGVESVRSVAAACASTSCATSASAMLSTCALATTYTDHAVIAASTSANRGHDERGRARELEEEEGRDDAAIATPRAGTGKRCGGEGEPFVVVEDAQAGSTSRVGPAAASTPCVAPARSGRDPPSTVDNDPGAATVRRRAAGGVRRDRPTLRARATTRRRAARSGSHASLAANEGASA